MEVSPARDPGLHQAPRPPLSAYVAPALEFDPEDLAALRATFRSGEAETDEWHRVLACAARARGAFDVALAEGIDALRQGDRLETLASHLGDYCREALDLSKRTALGLARLGRELRRRPLLREAMLAGRVRLRAAQTILRVPAGPDEAEWVERAAILTVRQLEEEVRRAGREPNDPDADEDWFAFGTHLRSEERALVDEALALHRELEPGATRMDALEAMAQELLAQVPTDADGDEARVRSPSFRRLGPGDEPRRAQLEAETERWSTLPRPADWPVPDVRFHENATAGQLDAQLRELVRLRRCWDDLLARSALALQRSGTLLVLGFTSFRHFCEEQLGLPARAVEQRVKLERVLSSSPALREARRQGVSYEKLRLLSRLSEADIRSFTPPAKALTCIDLERKLDAERERQMRARRQLRVPMPRRIAAVLAAALQAVRDRSDGFVSPGKCLALIAWHFLETWRPLVKPRKTRSRKVRERDGGFCRVPGCSHRGSQSHHLDFRSHGGSDDLDNQVALCPFHHLRCVHGGYLRVVGRAPDRLIWYLGGREWHGPAAGPP
jgi:hypothetical protein